MAGLAEVMALGRELGYEGEQLREFVQEERERMERERERVERREREEREHEEKKFERDQRALEREHQRQVELARLRQPSAENGSHQNGNGSNGNSSRLRPMFTVYREDEEIEAFIGKFERIAVQFNVVDGERAVAFLSCFVGEASSTLNRLGPGATYDAMKDALIKAYGVSTDAARSAFFTARLGDHETAAQFLVRLTGYLDRWIKKDGVTNDAEGIRDLFLRAQLERSAPPDLCAHFKISGVSSAPDMVATADAFFEAHGYDKRLKNIKHKGSSKRPNAVQPQGSQRNQDQEKKNPGNGKSKPQGGYYSKAPQNQWQPQKSQGQGTYRPPHRPPSSDNRAQTFAVAMQSPSQNDLRPQSAPAAPGMAATGGHEVA